MNDTNTCLRSSDKIAYCERFLELLIDLEAQLPTRRYFNTLVEDHQIVTICKLSNLVANKNTGTLFAQLLDILAFYVGFEINGHTGLALTKEEMTEIHASRLTKLQVRRGCERVPSLPPPLVMKSKH